ncbi:MAG: formylglycine-generating enzyme family protein [Thermoanaerobaculaceae bacterium]
MKRFGILAILAWSSLSFVAAQEMVTVDLHHAWVGCVPGDTSCPGDESPGGEVAFTPFAIDAYEVTVEAYRRFAAATGRVLPPQPPGSNDRSPVVNVTHGEAAAFCAYLGKRLPTEAEWEAAARGNAQGSIYPWPGPPTNDHGNFSGVGGKDRFPGLAPVGSFAPNSLGLFDMAGNVWEWVADDYLPKPPSSQAAAKGGKLKVVKGGAWNSLFPSLRISNRGRLPADTASDTVGFRCARESQPTAPEASAPESSAASLPQPAPEGPPPQNPALDQLPTPTDARAPSREEQVSPAQVPMVFLPGGSFERGCVKGDWQCSADEQPRRFIRLSPFAIGKTEVTVGQYRVFAEATGATLPEQPTWSGENFPVVNVTWEESQSFCTWLGGHLPTEAQWEYAARAGTGGTRFPKGAEISHEEANYDGVEGRDQFAKAAPVGSFPPNGFGLFDMLGNVWEWCLDWYQEDYYAKSPEVDPQGPPQGKKKVVRGGSFTSDPGRLRLSYRSSLAPNQRWLFTGFRCVLPGKAP